MRLNGVALEVDNRLGGDLSIDKQKQERQTMMAGTGS